MSRYEEVIELLELAYTGARMARSQEEVDSWESQIEELEAELEEFNRRGLAA